MIAGSEEVGNGGSEHVAVQLDGFAAEAVDEEAARLGVSVKELVSFSVLYYLADVDSGRIARQIGKSPLLGKDFIHSPRDRSLP